MRSLDRLLRPKTIAVYGGGWSGNVIRELKKISFSGELWAIHPTKKSIEGVKCYRSSFDLPASPDAAFAAANAGSDGKWAQRYDEFTDEDFKDFSTSPSGLQYKIIEEGFGVKPVSGQKIKAHYAGYLLNGAKFDSS